MSYNHGVRVSETPTRIISPRRVTASVPVVIGTAPVHMIAEGKTGAVNEAKLCYNYGSAVEDFGYSDDWGKYTLCEAVYAEFMLYAVAPIVLINVFNPAVHKTTVTAETKTVAADGTVNLSNEGLLEFTSLTNDDGNTTYVKDTDYTVDMIKGVITLTDESAITADQTVKAAYVFGDPSLVTVDDIIGGVDIETGAKTGVELINTVFPKFGIVAGSVIAPGWSHKDGVAAVLNARATNINNHFSAATYVDADDTVCKKYTDVPEYKNQKNLVDKDMRVCWGRPCLGEKVFWQSTQAAVLRQSVTADREGIPSDSISNRNYQMDRLIADGKEVVLAPEEANYLNANGIITALNFVGGWKCWGPRTAAYPGVTDPKDVFIHGRDLYNWSKAEVILTYYQKVDAAMNRRLIESILDSLNDRLNGLTAARHILGGEVQFNTEDNPYTDLMDGKMKFKLALTPNGIAEEILFDFEYEPSYLSSLFA